MFDNSGVSERITFVFTIILSQLAIVTCGPLVGVISTEKGWIYVATMFYLLLFLLKSSSN